jgi:hypothetical protein
MKRHRRIAFIVALSALALVAIGGGATGTRAASEDSMDDRCRAEVEQLHVFFEAWMSGTLEADPETFRRLSDVLAPEFEMISPYGDRTTRDELVAGLMPAHGIHAGRTRPFRIRIANYRGRSLSKEMHLVTYEEWQVIDGETRGRLSTALLRNREGTPNGVEWVHLHETWMPETEDGGRE